MGHRFAEKDVDKVELLLLIPDCIVDPKWRHKRDELEDRILKAAEVYKANVGAHYIRLPTELKLWIDYWSDSNLSLLFQAFF